MTQSLTTRFGNSGADYPDAEAGWLVEAASLTRGSAAGEGVSKPGRRQEDDYNLVPEVSGTIRSHVRPGSNESGGVVVSAPVTAKWSKGNGGPSGDECQNLTVEPPACGCLWEWVDEGGFCACCGAHLDDPRGLYAEQGGQHGFERCPRFEQPAAFVKRHGANHAEDHEIWDEGDIARSLNGMGQAGTNGALAVRAYHAYHGYEQDDDAVQTLLGGASGNHPSLHDGPILVEPPQHEAFNLMPEHGQGADLRAVETDEAAGIDVTGLSRSTDRGTRIVTEEPGVFLSRAYTRGKDGELADTSPSLTKEADRGDGHPQALVGGDVRRLTPTECERLQSLPDGWSFDFGPSLREGVCEATRAVLRGLACPVDHPPDGPRYAACGDAVTANVAEWIADRMRRVRAA